LFKLLSAHKKTFTPSEPKQKLLSNI